MRIALAAAFLVLAASAHAEEAGRYALSPSRDGIVRLDTATGAAAHCSPVKGVWHCQPLQIDNDRIDALAIEVAALNAKVAALGSSIKGPAPVTQSEPTHPNFVREALGRFLDLVRTLKHGRDA